MAADHSELAHALRVAALDGVRDRAVQVALRRVPGARPVGAARARSSGSARRSSARSMRASIGWQRYVASVLSTRADQRVRARQPAQHVARAGPAEHRVAERPREHVEHRRAAQELEPLRLQPGEQLVAQVVGGEPVVAAEAGDGAVRVRAPGQRERRQVQADGPALRPPDEQEHVLGRQVEPREAEHPRGLAARHREVARADVDQLALRAQPADRQRGLLARREHELRAVGQELRERGERAERLGRAHALQIVEHQHERAVDPLEQPGHVARAWRRRRRRGAAGRRRGPRARGRSARARAPGRRRPRRAGSSAPAGGRSGASATAASSCRSPPGPRAARAGRRRPGRAGGPAGRAGARRAGAAGRGATARPGAA